MQFHKRGKNKKITKGLSMDFFLYKLVDASIRNSLFKVFYSAIS